MIRIIIVAFSVALLAVLGGMWFVGQQPEPVTVPPRALVGDESPFEYPIQLWDQAAEGESVVMVHVDPAGTVDSVYILESSGEAAFDSVALDGARTIRFEPGRSGDEAVSAWVRLPVRFQLPADPAVAQQNQESTP